MNRNDHMSMALGLIRSIAPSHYSRSLAEDMVQAAEEWLVAHDKLTEVEATIWLSLRAAMIDELVRWLVGVTAHQKPRSRYDVSCDVLDEPLYTSEWSMRERCGIERRVMARECLRRIVELAGTMRRPTQRDAIWAVLTETTSRGPHSKIQFTARKHIRRIIADHC